MTSIDLNSMTAMNLDGLSTKIAVNDLNVWYGKFHALKTSRSPYPRAE